MAKDKGLAALLIEGVSKKKPRESDAAEGEEMEGDGEGYDVKRDALVTAFRDLKAALESGSDEAGADALEAAIEACG